MLSHLQAGHRCALRVLGLLVAVGGIAAAQEKDARPPSALSDLKIGADTASWMSCFHRAGSGLDGLTLKQICIPGTHDAGSYQALGAKGVIASRWVITQKLNLREQLEAGARRLDLRVMKVPEGADEGELEAGFYIHHGGFATVALGKALEQLKAYLDSDAARTETVLLEFSHFKGMTPGQNEGSDYAALLGQIEEAIGRHLLKRPEGDHSFIDLPLRKLKGKAVLLVQTGSFFEGVPDSPVVHRLHRDRPIYDRYANKDQTAAMVADQAKKFRDYQADDSLFLLNWTLTPGRSLRSTGGVRNLAADANPQLLKHFNDPALPFARPNEAGRIINVINVDFFGVRECEVLKVCVEVMRNSARPR
ncbi:phosphatidyl inositol phospholipase CX domain-containing protein [Haloferula helveola]|uniref:1-phosphatidylinositol phosphodiesterase n=1 Tax=Haloferula helveola TaxID=490095 RepID=A0ABN6H4N0_9BACT|nr:phosphatidyl inositol phospholipase CX domain-containing protein [Haloferula helveola]